MSRASRVQFDVAEDEGNDSDSDGSSEDFQDSDGDGPEKEAEQRSFLESLHPDLQIAVDDDDEDDAQIGQQADARASRPSIFARRQSRRGSAALREHLFQKEKQKRQSMASMGKIDEDEQETSYKRYESIESKLGLEFQETEVEKRVIHGPLIDFLCRLNPGDNTSDDVHPHDHVSNVFGGNMSDQHIQYNSYVAAIEAVNQEMLFSAILEDITVFWKERKTTEWAADKNALKNKWFEIIKIKKEVLCLRAEVDNWLMRHRLLNARPGRVETQKERHGRHQEFWAQFHEIPRKLEVRQSRSAEMKTRPRQDEPSTPMKGLEVKNRTGHDLHWKARPARSRCSAGAWDWSRASSRGSDRPMTGSGMWRFEEAPDFQSERGSDGLPRSAPSKPPKHRWWQTHQPDGDVVSPFVMHSKGLGSGASMAKSSSLPSLPANASPAKPWVGEARIGLPSEPVDHFPMPDNGAKGGPRRTLIMPPTFGTAIAPVDHFPMPENGMEIPELGRSKGPLPPISNAVVVPWVGKSPIPTLKCEETATKRYLCSVQASGCLPRPMPFLTGHSLCFNAADLSLVDSDLHAVVDMMPDVEVKEVDLEGNLLLSEKALVRFAKTLADPPASSSLEFLSLKRCVNAGRLVLDAFIKMMADEAAGCNKLRHLDLSGIPVGTTRHLPLSAAVGAHTALTELRLADTGLGGSPNPEQCVTNILGSRSIETLDLGWNCFSEEVFSLLGELVVEMKIIKKLSIPNCSAAGKPGHASPIVFFVEHLSRTCTLKTLDISLNRIDFRGALVVEDALEHRKCLTELNICSNPLGFLGTRCLLRLLSRPTSGLLHFSCKDCCTGKASDQSELYQVFCCTNPGGRYSLEFSRPYHRAILRMLYKTCEKYNLAPQEAFTDMKGSPPYTHATKGDCDAWMVPTKGTLAATFCLDKAVEAHLSHIDPWDFEKFMNSYTAMMRVQPAFHKVVPMLALWKSVDGQTMEQKSFLAALSKDFLLLYPHMEQMARSRAILSDLIATLLPCIEGGQLQRFLTMLLLPSLGEYVNIMKKQKQLLIFNVANPNGHYKLDLEIPADYAVAERLLLLDCWETAISRKLGRADTSQRGNMSQIRNERFQGRPLRHASIQEWNMPESDELEFDYSSGKRPPPDAAPIDSTTFSNILVTLQNSDCKPRSQVDALQLASHMMYVKAIQMRGLIGIFADVDARVDLFVLFFLRVVDFYNEKIYRVRFENQEELNTLSTRIGWVTMYPFIQPEQATFRLDLAYYDQRLAANLILALSGKESKNNLRDPSFVHADGRLDPLAAGIPRSWEVLEKMPKSGKLGVSYVCSPEDRNYKARRDLYEKYSYRSGVNENEVMWWAALNEAPEDVIEYLSFIITRFPSPGAAFVEIDGEGGNGVITLREFEEGYQEMKCQKFKGANEKQRIHSVFRYLDPSGEGQVSEEEWNVLELLWKEIKLSITEFVQFCERTFGDDLEETWVFMDEDGGGEIDMDEWCTACTSVGYFGPVVPIFGFLDADDEGTVSWDEFKQLETFQEAPENRHNARMEAMSSTLMSPSASLPHLQLRGCPQTPSP